MSDALLYKEIRRSACGKQLKWLLWAVVGVWLVGMFSALVAFGTFKVDASPMAMDYAIHSTLEYAIAVPLILLPCRMALGRYWSWQACLILSALTALMLVGISVNIAGWLSVEGSSWAAPKLEPYSDSGTVLRLANELWEGWKFESDVPTGYPRFILGCFNLFERGIMVPLLFNAFCMTASTALIGRLCVKLCPGGNINRRVWTSMLLFAIIPSVPFYGAVIMKEAMSTLAVSLFALLLADIYRGRIHIWSILGALAGTSLLMLLRHHIAYILGICAVVCFLHSWLRRKGNLSASVKSLMTTLALCAVAVFGGHCFRGNNDFLLIDNSKAESAASSMMHYDTVQKYSGIVPNYYEKTPLQKAVCLPITAAAQYFPPFPWNFTRDVERQGAFVPIVHLSFLWYFVGGLILGYFALCIYRKYCAGGLQVWALLWLMCYAGVAYISAGSVARYYLCFMPLCIPLALQTLLVIRHNFINKHPPCIRMQRYVYVYGAAYIVLLTAGLLIAYRFLKG